MALHNSTDLRRNPAEAQTSTKIMVLSFGGMSTVISVCCLLSRLAKRMTVSVGNNL